MFKSTNIKPGVVVHPCNPSTVEAEAGGGQPGWLFQKTGKKFQHCYTYI
jgi:hypothetical protein